MALEVLPRITTSSRRFIASSGVSRPEEPTQYYVVVRGGDVVSFRHRRLLPFVEFGASNRHVPLVFVSVVVVVVVVATGEHHFVSDVGMATDLNTPQWWSKDQLLIRGVGH